MVIPCKCASPHTLNGCLARCQGGGRAGRLGIWKGRGRACGKGHTTVAGAARFRLRQCRQPFVSREARETRISLSGAKPSGADFSTASSGTILTYLDFFCLLAINGFHCWFWMAISLCCFSARVARVLSCYSISRFILYTWCRVCASAGPAHCCAGRRHGHDDSAIQAG